MPLSVPLGQRRSLNLRRAVVRRALADRGLVLATWLLLLAALTLVATSVMYADAVALASVRSTLATSPPSDRTIVVRAAGRTADVQRLDQAVFGVLAKALARIGGNVALVIRTDALVPAGLSANDTDHQISLAAYDALDRHASLVAGTWPVARSTPRQAVVSEGAAQALGVATGDRIALVSRLDATARTEVMVVGIWRPSATDPFWLADPLELDGRETSGAFTALGPVVVPRDDLLADARGQVHLEWRALPELRSITADDLGTLRKATDAVPADLRAALPDVSATTSTTLPGAVASLERAVTVSRTAVVLLIIQFAALAGYAVLLVASVLVDRRRPEVAMFRARGATVRQLSALAVIEALLLAVPAAALAPVLGLALAGAPGLVPPLAATGIVLRPTVGWDVVLAVFLAALAGVIALAAPTLASEGRIAGVRASIARPIGTTLAQRLGLDVVLIVVATVGLWQLRLYGSPLTNGVRGSLGVDPLLVAAPAIGLLAGGVLSARVVPRIAEVAERLLRNRRGLVPSLGAREVARRPLRSTRSALLLVLAAALATFAATYAATWTRSQHEQAAYAAAADVRAGGRSSHTLPDWAVGPAYRAIPGVSEVVPVGHSGIQFTADDREGQLLAIPTGRLVDVVGLDAYMPDGGPAFVGAALGAAPPTPPTVALPPDTLLVSVTIDARLVPRGTDPAPAETGRITVAVIADGPDGLVRIEGATLAANGGTQRATISVAANVAGSAAPIAQLRLEGVELAVVPAADGGDLVGDLSIVALETSVDPASATSPTWRPLAVPGDGWRWDRVATNTVRVIGNAPGEPLHLLLGGPSGSSGGGAIPAGAPTDPGVALRFRADPPDVTRLNAVVSTALARSTGAAAGTDLRASLDGRPLPIRVTAVVDRFAPLDPTLPFAVVDSRALEWLRFGSWGTTAAPEEWWFRVGDGASADVSARLVRPPFSAATVVSRDAEARSRSGDAVALATIGALLIGAVAALLIAGIGFIVAAVASTTERLAEFALLRALGLSARSLGWWLTAEQALLLAFGMVAGCVLGLLLAWLVLPFASLTSSGDAPVPPAAIEAPWQVAAALLALALLLLAGATIAARRQIPGLAIGRLLRSGEA